MPKIDYSLIPEHMMEAMKTYVERHEPTEQDDFLEAVICNDMTQAFQRADDTNVEIVFQYVCWFYNEAPSICWGSREKMEAWLKHSEWPNPYDRQIDEHLERIGAHIYEDYQKGFWTWHEANDSLVTLDQITNGTEWLGMPFIPEEGTTELQNLLDEIANTTAETLGTERKAQS
jgi:hypothetical protein